MQPGDADPLRSGGNGEKRGAALPLTAHRRGLRLCEEQRAEQRREGREGAGVPHGPDSERLLAPIELLNACSLPSQGHRQVCACACVNPVAAQVMLQPTFREGKVASVV